MRNALLHWFLSAFALWVVSEVVSGFVVSGLGAALLAALVVGFVNATLGFFLKLVTLPLTLVTFGLFLLIINAVMLQLSALIIPGFEIQGFLSAFVGAIVLALVNVLLRAVVGVKD